MEGVTTAIVLFVFVCILFPRLIDNRPQYYAAFVCVLILIVLDAVARLLIGSADARAFCYLGMAVLQIAAIVLLFLSAGGLTVRGLTREMAGAFEVVRRGETQKEVIIPIGGQKSGGEKRKRAVDTAGEPPERINLDAETAGGPAYPARKPAAPPPPAKKFADDDDEDGPIPME